MKKLAWLTLVFLLFASPVSAEIREGSFSVTTGALGYLSDGVQHQHLAPGIALKLGYDFTKNFGLEGNFDYVLSESSVYRGSDSYWGSRYAFRLDALYHFMPEKRFVPYVSGGAGFMYYDDLYPRFGSAYHTDMLISVGGGAEFFLTDSLALRMDLRPVVTFGDGTFINTEAMLGLSYHFGGVKKATATVATRESRMVTQEEAVVSDAAPAPVPLPAPVDEGPTYWEGTVDRVPAGKIMITSMRIEGNALLITTTGRIANFKAFSLAQPSRLIIDMPDTVNGMGTDRIAIRKLGIASVRFGSYPDSLRLVLDAEQSELFPYRIEEMETGLKIIMSTPQE